MNRRLRALTVLPIFLLVLSCASAPPETRCYQVVNGIAITVDTGMKAFADLYVQGRVLAADGATFVVTDPTKVKITEKQKDAVLAAHAKYQSAIQAAGHGCMGLQDSKDISKLTADAQAALGDLLGLIAQLKGGS